MRTDGDDVAPTPVVTIRRAAPADLPAMGRLGALLVRVHHAFDARRFITATPRTEHAYASFLGTQLEARGAPQVVLSTAERNEAARRLFARAGFRPTMIEMTRELDGGASRSPP